MVAYWSSGPLYRAQTWHGQVKADPARVTVLVEDNPLCFLLAILSGALVPKRSLSKPYLTERPHILTLNPGEE